MYIGILSHQDNYVTVNHIIARATIDEDVMQVLQKKRACQEDILEAGTKSMLENAPSTFNF